MTKSNGASQALFEEKLKNLLPQLRSLASVSPVTWFHQVPVIELFADVEAANTYVHSTKIRHYNRATRRIFK